MANEVKEAVLVYTERQLKVMKQYLPYIVIACLAWALLKQYDASEKMRREMNDMQQEQLKYERENYKRSIEAYEMMVRELRNPQNQGK